MDCSTVGGDADDHRPPISRTPGSFEFIVQHTHTFEPLPDCPLASIGSRAEQRAGWWSAPCDPFRQNLV